MYNSIGQIFRITSYGESHGEEVGVIIDGCPANFEVDLAQIQLELDRRKPGQSEITTSRSESDQLIVRSGIFEGKTTGAPILFAIKNKDQRSKDYDKLRDVYRPSHADFTYSKKYGHRDHRGGGRSSARITAAWVAAGALAKQLLDSKEGLQIHSYIQQIHTIVDETPLGALDWNEIRNSDLSCSPSVYSKFIESIQLAKAQGDSLGGIVRGIIQNPPIGMGEPVFGKLQAVLSQYLLSINATKGISFGEGFNSAILKGSEYNDQWDEESGQLKSNRSGGIQGGISNGEPIYFDLAFRPTSSIAKTQTTLSEDNGVKSITIEGRHDPCVLPRAVPIVEAMAALCILDMLLIHRTRNYD